MTALAPPSFLNRWPKSGLTWAIALGCALVYAPLLLHWVDGWLSKSISTEHEYFSHGLIGLPFAAYLSGLRREQWSALRDRFHPLGAGLLGGAAVLYLSNVPDFVNASLPVFLVGLSLALKGPAGLRLQAFPLLLVALATPNELPYLIAPFTLPLQAFIAAIAGFLLMQFQIPVTVDGIYLLVNDRTVEVAPYCAGLKMLFTTLYVCLMLLYWSGLLRSRSRSFSLLCGAILISVGANIVRNTLLTFFHGTGRDRLFEWLHDSWGGDLYSALMLLAVVCLLRLFEAHWPLPSHPSETP